MSNIIERWIDNKRLSPLHTVPTLQDSFDRLFNEVLSLKQITGVQDFSFSPTCEIFEEGNSYVLKVDLPGVSKNDVVVECDKDQLIIRAERKEEKKQESKKKYLSETFYGSYTRSFTLPSSVDDKKVDAKFENGVLTVTVPKTETPKAKQIPIQ